MEGEHLDPTTEISLETVKERSVRGIVVLTGRTFLLQIIGLVAQLFLFAYLGKYEFGVFAIVSAIINFLVYFSDIGLAAALIQKKDKPTDSDLKTTFFVQQLLVLSIIIAVFLLAPFFVQKYSLNWDGRILLYALSVSLLFSSLKSIPSVLLERKLEFVKLVFPQILEQVVYNVVLVLLAMKGFGLMSFTYAILLRGVIGVIAIYTLQPWIPGVAFSRKTLSGLFKFGIPYQINTFLATFKDDGMTLVLGGILGPAGVGILSFAQKISRLPLTFFMDTVTRVTFPAFSRMQDAKADLERSVTRSVFFICFLVFPSLVGISILAPILVRVIPRYSQWIPALVPIIFISINFVFAAATTQLTNLLNAIGKIKITFYLMVMWTALTWALVPVLAIKFDVVGAAIGYSLVGASSVVAIFITKKYINFSITDSMIKPAVGAVVMGAVLLMLRGFLPTSLVSMEILIVTGMAIYATSMISMMGLSLIEDAKKSFKTIFNR
ncbi:MAG: Polysaccharide biosynthesis protein [Microgenomates group bacterium GW2011_GWC1_39_7b]|uniref:Polysaccharide biosynthesis protein n=3 Tax=Candidatus Woeseibacteriota TaxID=1752722 RepID=A0A0G0P190_9BACT|nr:MAG: Polysaccharide biosynthesis protein [Candidatus Woesebacteria bacterium GW2011_GWB1_39_10]KKR27043.1 MAG: Polysaccharide biosynthesis protein [Microgenomates group bacterium GW2011_GWC1_39_7b]KKR74125.1 MAG: Polysaccharide biosynthesis protein [Candidatus Woesebacteria bacterium GW2011_GWA2_40_7]KKS90854.1 MAG: Polysaccharide biosynthesis protein [Candidatus Woesebacteria bacterium GW2011_GWA1_43_12]